MRNGKTGLENVASPLAVASCYCSPTDVALVGFSYMDVQEIGKRLHFGTNSPVTCYGFDGESSLVLVQNPFFFADIYVFSSHMGQSNVSGLVDKIRKKHVEDGLACRDPVFIGDKPLDVRNVSSPSAVVESLLPYLTSSLEEN